VLQNINFRTYQDQITAILGPSGCGKTTLLKHVIGLLPVQEGSVHILGKNLADIGEREKEDLFLQMGVLFQNGALLNSLTVGENIALPLQQHTAILPDVIEEIVRLKLHLVNLEGAYDKYPAELSGGMRKRAALARAIAMDPPILFCDEPGAGLDPISLAALDELILKLKEQLNIHILIVTHEVASIYRLADRIVFLDEGELLYEGRLDDVEAAGKTRLNEFFKKANQFD
jgi:phospholipid/cholesterol/gamma-HCH transport system ATP-binding protein